MLISFTKVSAISKQCLGYPKKPFVKIKIWGGKSKLFVYSIEQGF